MRRRRMAASSVGLICFLMSWRRAFIRSEQERSQVSHRAGSSDVGILVRRGMSTFWRVYLERMRGPRQWHE